MMRLSYHLFYYLLIMLKNCNCFIYLESPLYVDYKDVLFESVKHNFVTE